MSFFESLKTFRSGNNAHKYNLSRISQFVTTDDHLMHITGIAKDQNGTKYYITKNSWGADGNKFGGYLNMSESYVRAKTICVMVHKDSLPKELRKKLGIN